MNKPHNPSSIRLCIYTLLRVKDFSKIPGIIIKEASDFGAVFDEVIMIHFYTKYSNRLIRENVRLITIPYIQPTTPLKTAFSIICSFLLSTPLLICVRLRYKVNLFRADDILISGIPCIVASKLTGCRNVVVLNGDVEEVVRYKIGKKSITTSLALILIRCMEKFVISHSDMTIGVNRKLMEIAVKFGARKTSISYPNVDLSMFFPKETEKDVETKRFTVLFVGRLEPEKGPLNILKVADILRDIDFKVIGDGTLRREMEQIAKDRNISNVVLMGTIAHESLPEIYHHADVLLLPSYSEGMPIVMLEAMASGLPVIVSDVGAVGDILEGNNGGFAIQPGNIEQMISTIRLLQNNPSLRSELGRKALIKVRHDFKNFIGDQAKLYKTVVEIDH